MTDTVHISLNTKENCQFSGESLYFTLYHYPVTIYLKGDLGAGKTTFLQGLAKVLGIREPITSPTYALEQRYPSFKGEFLHLDLYRLKENQALELVDSTDNHEGIRAIEWAERLGALDTKEGIHLSFSETSPSARELAVVFSNIPLPSRDDILSWRKEMMLPPHICAHCDAVADLAERIGKDMTAQARIHRPLTLRRAAEVHDLLRFVDFRPGASHSDEDDDPKAIKLWEDIKKKYPGMRHEAACTALLKEKRFDALAQIVEVHGLTLPSPDRVTIEQQILFYADKRMKVDELVSLDERFEDFAVRYGAGKDSEHGKIWYDEAKRVEEILYPNGAPF